VTFLVDVKIFLVALQQDKMLLVYIIFFLTDFMLHSHISCLRVHGVNKCEKRPS
jgi:hypothetical protein